MSAEEKRSAPAGQAGADTKLLNCINNTKTFRNFVKPSFSGSRNNRKLIDSARLEKVRRRGEKTIARCPACAEQGRDNSGEHLVVYDNGAFGCIVHANDKLHHKRILELVGIESYRHYSPRPFIRTRASTRKLELPSLRIPTVGELDQIAQIRGLPFFAGLELATRAGHLRTATLRDASEDVTAWLLLDSSARCAQARRLDGKLWCGINAKAKTLVNSQARWPIGSADIGSKPFVALCEGGPDTLAAWSFVWWHGQQDEIAPCCMAGAGMRIHEDALPLFRGKGVFLTPHRDKDGATAAALWTAQLREVGAKWVQQIDVAPHKDLNEFLSAAAGRLEGSSNE
jgi:hypothetical protein